MTIAHFTKLLLLNTSANVSKSYSWNTTAKNSKHEVD